MKTRFLSVFTALFICLGATACVRSVDNTKVRCTTSDHCPSSYVCSAGQCVSSATGTGGTSAVDGARSDATGIADAGPDQAIGSDSTETRNDVAPSGSDADVAQAPGAGGAAGAGAGGTGGAGGLGSGGVGGLIGGSPGSGGIAASGGAAASGGNAASGGAPGSGGKGAGGQSATGGTGSGGTGTGGVGSGGTGSGGTGSGGTGSGGTGSGGTGSGGTGTGGAPCQPKSRDCTSALDNNCNGTPDNQETSYCVCPAGQSRRCQEHAGYDGVGICKYGNQTCSASSDKTTSSWGDCTGAVGPGTEVCDATGLDENCNGQSNEGCECVNGASVPCDCGSPTTCTNGKKGTCSQSKVTMYQDSDHDGFGNPAKPSQQCPNAAGYSENAEDCDDGNSAFYPGVSVCAADNITLKWCDGSGVTQSEPCDDGCGNGMCRIDGTVGLPGYVSCTDTHSPRCLASQGCNISDGTCGGALYCDGPNDCPSGQKCWYRSGRGYNESNCYASQPDNTYEEVCDPYTAACNCGWALAGVLHTCQ